MSKRRPLTPWFDAACRARRRDCRRLERRYRRTHNIDDRSAWTANIRTMNAFYKGKEREYWTAKIEAAGGNSSKLWKSLSALLQRNDTPGSASVIDYTSDDFLNFFDKKVTLVRSQTGKAQAQDLSNPATSNIEVFRVYTIDEVRQVIMSSPTKSCELDPIPTFLLKELLNTLLPIVTAMCNASLKEGLLPPSERHALVRPLLKKSNLDPSELKNYRPVSNISFMSKVIERIVSKQIVAYLQANDLLPCLQSAYRKHHSTETALLKVLSDTFLAADAGSVTLLGLLDLSAAFDTVDHYILLRRLHHSFGFNDVVLSWITSFLDSRTQQVEYRGVKSALGVLISGVPQGSVLGPLLFSLYTTDLFNVIENCGMRAHCYADDTQTYISTPAKDAASAKKIFINCVARVEQWMDCNRLKLNADKTQIIWLGTRQQLSQVNRDAFVLGSSSNYSVNPSDSANNLGFIFDSNLNFSKHILNTCKLCFYQLRQMRTIRRTLTTEATSMLVHAFISSRLDYCNSLIYGASNVFLSKLQRVQNAAARLIVNKRKYDQ